jgi:hypothetical protein
LVERAKYPELNGAASAVFGVLKRVAISADEQAREEGAAGKGLVVAYCSVIIDVPLTENRDSAPRKPVVRRFSQPGSGGPEWACIAHAAS